MAPAAGLDNARMNAASDDNNCPAADKFVCAEPEGGELVECRKTWYSHRKNFDGRGCEFSGIFV